MMRSLFVLLAMTCFLAAPSFAAAADGDCGPAVKPSCAKCCQVVCEWKEVKKTIWAVECEEFCTPSPGCFSYGKARVRKKLLRKEITVKVPVYRCVPVTCTCGGGE